MDTIKINKKKVKMVAHRGVSGLERENTCPAFIAAGRRSYYGVETDVHISGDGQFVVIHDGNTKRITLEQTNINVLTEPYSAYKDLILPDLDGSTHRTDIRIPLLKDYISICKQYQKFCVLEIKDPLQKEELVRLAEEIKAQDYLDNMIYIAFDLQNCIYLRELLPNARIQWLFGQRMTDDLVEILKKHHLDLDIMQKRVTPELVEKIHAAGLEINCWTCDDPARAEALAEMGVDYITSNILE